VHGRFTTRDATQTEALGARLARELAPGDAVLVEGELGAGKTTFVRGAARALGVTVPVTSPTFTIGQRYPAAQGRVVAHVDLYRLAALADEDPELLADYLSPEAVAFVEWPRGEAAQISALTRVVAGVALEHDGGDRRRVRIG
jgi:tRNA threonylcarbamoyladenosine biosynthesis protein TsaE